MMSMMILPQANLKAKDLPRDLLPNKAILQAYADVGKDNEYNNMTHLLHFIWTNLVFCPKWQTMMEEVHKQYPYAQSCMEPSEISKLLS